MQHADTLTLHPTTTTDTGATASTDLAHDININPWNAFQHRYKGHGLSTNNFSTFYKWNKRLELEKTNIEPEVVQQFLAYLKECEDDPLPELC